MNKVLCDQCGNDLSTTSNSVAYSITLNNRQIPCHDGWVTDAMIHPTLNKNMDFCNLNCLRSWLKSESKE